MKTGGKGILAEPRYCCRARSFRVAVLLLVGSFHLPIDAQSPTPAAVLELEHSSPLTSEIVADVQAGPCVAREISGVARLPDDPRDIEASLKSLLAQPQLNSATAYIAVKNRRVRLEDLSFLAHCTDHSTLARSANALAFLGALFLVPQSATLVPAPGPSLSWKFVRELQDPAFGYLQTYQLLFNGKPVVDAVAQVHVTEGGDVTEATVALVTQSDYAGLVQADMAPVDARAPEKFLGTLGAHVGASEDWGREPGYVVGDKSSPFGPTHPTSVWLVHPPASSGSFQKGNDKAATYVIDANTQRLIFNDLGGGSPAQAAPRHVATRDMSGNTADVAIQWDDQRQQGILEVEDHSTLTRPNHADTDVTLDVAALIDGAPIILRDPLLLDVSQDPPRDAALHGVLTMMSILKGILKHMGTCGFTETVLRDGSPCAPDRVVLYIHAHDGFDLPGEYQPGGGINALAAGFHFGTPGNNLYGSDEAAVVGHEVVHALLRTHDFRYGLCSGRPGEPAMAIEEALADGIGVLLVALSDDTPSLIQPEILRSIYDATFQYKPGYWRSLRDPAKNHQWDPIPLKALANDPAHVSDGAFEDAWKSVGYSQPTDVSQIIPLACDPSVLPIPQWAVEQKYINAGPLASVAYQLATFDAPHSALKEGRVDWLEDVTRVLLSAAYNSSCEGGPTGCGDFCDVKEDVYSASKKVFRGIRWHEVRALLDNTFESAGFLGKCQ